VSGLGIETLLKRIEAHIEDRIRYSPQSFLVSNLRHRDILQSALSSVERARISLSSDMSEEFAMVDLHQALQKIGEITGEVTIDDIYQHIFSHFCIGK